MSKLGLQEAGKNTVTQTLTGDQSTAVEGYQV